MSSSSRRRWRSHRRGTDSCENRAKAIRHESKATEINVGNRAYLVRPCAKCPSVLITQSTSALCNAKVSNQTKSSLFRLRASSLLRSLISSTISRLSDSTPNRPARSPVLAELRKLAVAEANVSENCARELFSRTQQRCFGIDGWRRGIVQHRLLALTRITLCQQL